MPHSHTIASIAERVNSGALSAESIVEEALDFCLDPDGQGQSVFTLTMFDEAIERARALDVGIKGSHAAFPLAGATFVVKDLFDVGGTVTTAGSVALRDKPPAQSDAPAVARLKDSGAIMLGKSNMTEFAYSVLGINPHYGTPLNPFDRDVRRIAGGSSSGSAVAVTDKMCAIGLGTDTGGSLRVPAAFCGLVGFRPSVGRISTTGMIPLSYNNDTVGALTRSVRECMAVDAVLSGNPIPQHNAETSVRHMRFLVPTNGFLDDLEPSVGRHFQRTIGILREAGATIVEQEVQLFTDLRALNAGGGFVAAEAYSWHQHLLDTKGDLYDPMVAVKIRMGSKLPAYQYLQLIRERNQCASRLIDVLSGYDAVLSPTVAITAPELAPLLNDEALYQLMNERTLRNTVTISMFQGCSISIPCHVPGDLPVGLMISGPPHADARVLNVAAGVEQCIAQANRAYL